VALRREDRNWLKDDEFPNEQGVLMAASLLRTRCSELFSPFFSNRMSEVGVGSQTVSLNSLQY
jgi:hypothetical protein